MNELKATPGPWYSFWNGSFWQINTESEEFPGMCIGNSNESCQVFDVNQKPHNHAEANAKVMAASRELLEALQDIVSACEGTFDVVALDLTHARAAIAKALTPQS